MQVTLEDSQWKLTEPIVNVASVRHLSPFRYPGGKTWLVPRVLSTLRRLGARPRVFVDPFLGGGSVPLAVLAEDLVDQAVLCELDGAVSAVWRVIFSADSETLAEKILEFNLTRENVVEIVEGQPQTLLDRAFQTIVRNRTFRGGILANGASLIRSGENGRGLSSRWYPETLVRRIRFLNTLAPRVTFVEGDGLAVLSDYAGREDVFIFVDPPYTAGGGKRAGSRLYDHSTLDHEAVFRTLESGLANFMMTYDDDLDVLRMAKRSGFVLQHVGMKNSHHRCMSELLISRN